MAEISLTVGDGVHTATFNQVDEDGDILITITNQVASTKPIVAEVFFNAHSLDEVIKYLQFQKTILNGYRK